jgi:hypothetical protein
MADYDLTKVLSELDHIDNKQWTIDNLPSVEYIRKVTGDETINRKMITEADPEFKRLFNLKEVEEVEPDEDDFVATSSEQTKEELDEEIQSFDSHISILMAERDSLIKKRDFLQELEFRKDTANNSTQTRLDYIRSCNQRAVERSGQRISILGVDNDPRSPIDRSFQRKNVRGTKRPEFPVRK